jgi:serine/threonine-protein kinase
LPRPATANAEALAAYQEGMQATRDASMDAARRSFERAVALDPTFAAALLRLAITSFDASPADARDAFARAARMRGVLGAHDDTLLDATEPLIQRQPSDFAEWEKRLARAVDSAPKDADFLYMLGNAHAHRGDLEGALGVYRRATDVDEKFARALWATGETEAYLGRFDASLASLGRCLDGAPGATSCLATAAWVYEAQGRCADVEATARRWIATEGDAPGGYDLLAKALLALGRPMTAVTEALQQKWARTPDKTRAGAELVDRIDLALVAGRFVDAEADASALEQAVSGDATLDAHARPALALVRIDAETGRAADAAQVANGFLQRMDAYVADPREEDFALAKDPTPEMLAARARGGRWAADDVGALRAAWLATWSTLPPLYHRYLWLHGFAKVAEDEATAKQALAALPDYEPLPPFHPLTFADGDVGRTYFLAGDAVSAEPYLERAAHSCVALDFPIGWVRSWLFLGLAREARGDGAGACEAYRAVLDRWGDASPPSGSARRAGERARALRCF